MPNPTSLAGATIVFDLDGTLIDTAPDLIAAANHAFIDAGVGSVATAILRPWISYGARRMIVEGLLTHGVTLPEAEVDRLLALFLVYYEANIAAGSRPFPGCLTALDALAASGCRLAICTNKREGLATALLSELGLIPRFQAIAGRDTFAVSKPDPGHLISTITMAGGTPHRAVMVGDSEVDIATAKAAGIPIVAVSFGYSDGPLDRRDPEALIDHYGELIPGIGRLLQR